MSIWSASIELANRVYTAAYVVLVIGAIATAVATMSLFWASALRDRYADGQIASAQAAAARANERADLLEVQAASLQKETAEAQADAERERTSRAAFEAQFSWRTIDDADRTTLVRELSITSHTVAIEFPSGDQEAQFVVLQLAQIFAIAGWKVVPRSVPAMPLIFGLDVPGPENDAVSVLRRALTVGNLAPAMTDIGIPGIFLGTDEGNKLTPDCRLIVGSKMTETVRRTLFDPRHPVAAPPTRQ